MAKTKEISVPSENGNLKFFKEFWYEDLVRKTKTILAECADESGELNFQLKWAKVRAMHAIGGLMLDNLKNMEQERDSKQQVTTLAQSLAKSVGISERDIFYCLAYAKKYPDISKTPDGKVITWGRLKREHLTESAGGKKEECKHEHKREEIVHICTSCGLREVVKK